ncbi:hypothetical protein FGG08_002735 [Glutinoglossum americanum]|uniref:Uncharacterized protein n=1 Tax=Glutinoglossum americanum TaxID=1670608 RepID=A0A9P8KYV1_9PEZI|nr:hypothetical protein FGG08_002735 [Glutinoglossum americanum]
MLGTIPVLSGICLRCQMRLGRRLRPDATTAIQFQRFASSRQFARAPTENPSGQIVDGHIKRWKPKSGFGKLRGLDGFLARTSVANLETGALGEPAQVIILRDALLEDVPWSPIIGTHTNDVIQDFKSIQETSPGTENITVTELLARAEEERGLISREDVNKNIETLRLQHATVLSQEDFSKLVDGLSRGFTTAQLADYMKDFKAGQPPNGSEQERKGPADSEITGWTPKSKPRGEKGAVSATVQSVSLKQKYAINILKNCWGIQTQEGYESVGHIELCLGYQVLSLLLRESKSFERNPLMQSLSETYNCQVGVSRSRGIVRITGRKCDAQNLVLALNKTARSIACEEFNMTPFLRGDIDGVDMIEKHIIEAISQTTGTEIKPGECRNKFNIYFWSWNTVNLEKARRLLLARLELPDRAKSAVFADTESVKGRLAFCRTEPGVELPLNERSTQWSRWRSRSTKKDGNSVGGGKRSTNTNQNSGAKSGKSVVAQIQAFLQPEEPGGANNHPDGEVMKGGATAIIDYESTLDQVNLSNTGAQNSHNNREDVHQRPPVTNLVSSVSVRLGQTLHNTSGLSPVRPGQVKELLSNNTDKRFLTGLPGLPNLLHIMKPLETESRQYLATRLIPSPWMPSGLESITKFPPVEILMQVNENTGESQPPVVQAVVEENIADLMLPNRQADLRFSKRTTALLLETLLDEKIKGFVKSGQLRADGIQTPGALPSVELLIPKKLISGDSTLETGEFINGGGEGFTVVQYVLAGADIQQTVQFEYNGWKVRYSGIDSGKIRGRRVELLMMMSKVASEADGSSSGQSPDFSTFFDDARRLVAEFDEPSSECPPTDLAENEPAQPSGS